MPACALLSNTSGLLTVAGGHRLGHLPVSSSRRAIALRNDLRSDFTLATFAFDRAVFNEARTVDAKMPIIAITTKSSMSVNPVQKSPAPRFKCLKVFLLLKKLLSYGVNPVRVIFEFII